jgi:hypothetical protein
VEQFQVAHLKVQNVDVVVVFVNSSVGQRSFQDQQQLVATLQVCASAAGLAGNVVLVWMDPLGRLNFVAPPNQHPFFKSVTYQYLYAHINKTLTCA